MKLLNMVLSKILNVGIARVVLGILLGSTLNSSSWAMVKEEDLDRKSCNIHSGRLKQLQKYAIEIIEYHTNDKNRPYLGSPSDAGQAMLQVRAREYDCHLSHFFECPNKEYSFSVIEYSFKPRFTIDLLYLNAEEYVKKIKNDVLKREPNPLSWIKASEFFKLRASMREINSAVALHTSPFMNSCYSALEKFTLYNKLKKLKKAILDSDFETYRLLFLKDEKNSLYFLPNELKVHIISIAYWS